MYEISCFDSDGNTIDYFNQWDVDQKVVIVFHGCDYEYLSIAPNIHFSNTKRSKNGEDAFVVRSTVTNYDTVTADIPNVLLQEAYPLLVYVYLTDNDDVSSQKTILSTEIAVRKRPKPSKYNYVENIERITAQQIKKEIKNEVVDEINDSNISFMTVTLIDTVNNQPYNIYFSEGKLKFDSIDRSKVPLKSITFTDRITTEKHTVYMANGKIVFDLDVEGEV